MNFQALRYCYNIPQGQGLVTVCALVQAAFGCCILLLDGLDPLQLALVVFFLPSISAKTSLALAVGIICNLCWSCFLDAHTTCIHPAAAHCNLH